VIDTLKENKRINKTKFRLYSIPDLQQVAFGHATQYVVQRGYLNQTSMNKIPTTGRHKELDEYFKAVKDYAKELHAVQEEMIK
jgi:hypothetical protein